MFENEVEVADADAVTGFLPLVEAEKEDKNMNVIL